MKIRTNNLIVIIYLILASILIFTTNDLVTFCLLNVGLLFLLCIILKLDIKNPMLLFLVVFILYQISYPILNKMNIKVFEESSLNNAYFFYNWIATLSFIFFYGSIENVKYDKSKLSININKSLLHVIYILLCLICLISSFYIIKSGYQSKYDLSNSKNLLISIGNISYITLIIYPLYFMLSSNVSKKSKVYIGLFNFLLMMLGMFTFGERSYLFNYMIVILIYYFTQNKISIKKIAIISILSMLVLSLSSSMKMLFASSKYKNSLDKNLVVNFLNSDFASAGFNFNFLLNNGDSYIFKGKTYIYDFLSPLEDVIPVSQYSPTQWYTNTYWSARKTGLGFSMMGEGYINFGLIGIIIQIFILARMTKFMYKSSNKGYYYYIVYIGYISLLMYSCRQALGNIISPLFKYHILLALLIYFINKIILTRKGDQHEK